MELLDGLILALFALYAIRAGLRARKVASRNLEEYFLAGRTLSGWKAGISMAATQFAADTPLLVTGLVATAGIFSLWRLWIYALAFLLLGFVLAPSWRRSGVLTDAELSELRYGRRAAAVLRGIKAVYFGTIFNCTVLAMVLFAAVAIAEPFLLWDQWLPPALFGPVEWLVRTVGVPFAVELPGYGYSDGGAAADLWVRSARNLLSIFALATLTTLYSATGGLRSVVSTDLVQFALMMGASAGYAFYVVDGAGGLDAIAAGIRERYAAGGPGGITPDQILAFTPGHARDASVVVLAVIALQWLVQMNADGTGYLAQRTMACRSDDDARRASLVFTVAQVLLRSLVWLPIALGLLVLLPPDPGLSGELLRAEREASFVRGIQSLPPGLLGLMLTAMFAALASTLDSHLNWGSSYWTHDLYARFLCRGWLRREPGGRELVWVARLSNFGILVVALAVMTQLSSIQTAWQVSLLLGAGMGVMLVLRWVWWRVTARGEIATVVTSTVLAPLLLFALPAEAEAVRMLCMALGATAAGVLVSLFGAPESPESLLRFYERARPPGFWGPVARAAGDEPRAVTRRLGSGLVATFLAAGSVFAVLTALGSWLARSPAPAWLPVGGRGLWIALLLCAGGALVPVWWRLAFPTPR
ncbi:MAG: sodium transporter [Proteobacteria bacterium]|nr:sodium transporter [Pseudomonadota bacterium]